MIPHSLSRHFAILWTAFFACCSLLLGSCGKENACKVTIGPGFDIDPNSATYSGLNIVGGYEYISGGHRGIIVIRTALNEYAAFERTCPCDNSSRVEISQEWGSALLECPTCHSLFDVNNFGMPMNGSATPCNLYQYNTLMDNGILHVY